MPESSPKKTRIHNNVFCIVFITPNVLANCNFMASNGKKCCGLGKVEKKIKPTW